MPSSGSTPLGRRESRSLNRAGAAHHRFRTRSLSASSRIAASPMVTSWLESMERAKRRRLDFEPSDRGVALFDGDSPCPEQSRERRLGHRRTDTPQLSPRFRSLRKSTARRERVDSGDKHATDDERRHISVQFRHVRQHFDALSPDRPERGNRPRDHWPATPLLPDSHPIAARTPLEFAAIFPFGPASDSHALHHPWPIRPRKEKPPQPQKDTTFKPDIRLSINHGQHRSLFLKLTRTQGPLSRASAASAMPPDDLRWFSMAAPTIRVISSFVASAELVFSQLTAEATASPAASCCSLRSVDRCIAVI